MLGSTTDSRKMKLVASKVVEISNHGTAGLFETNPSRLLPMAAAHSLRNKAE